MLFDLNLLGVFFLIFSFDRHRPSDEHCILTTLGWSETCMLSDVVVSPVVEYGIIVRQ